MNNTFRFIMLVALSLSYNTISSQGHYDLYQKSVFVNDQGDSLNYRLLLPENYNSDEEYPFIIFLHGAGERGADNSKQLVHGSFLFTFPANRKEFPAIVVFPQCPKGTSWSNREDYLELRQQQEVGISEKNYPATPVMKMVIQMISDIKKTYSVDPRRMYVMGLSMGGFGTFDLVYRKPEWFAAAVPVCGGGLTGMVENYARIPFWVIHGTDDTVVPPELSREMVKAMVDNGISVKYTEYPGVGHNSWDHAFAEPDLLHWIFKQHKSN